MSFLRLNYRNRERWRDVSRYFRSSCLIAIFVAGVLADGRMVLAKLNVRQEFNKARQLFDRGRLQDAVKVLKRILKRNPKNKAAYHLLGRIYYRGGRVKAAAKFFARSGGAFLYTGGAFEYGIAMFSVRRCTKALEGFKRVQSGPFADLARFYSGVCHFRARRWYPAESELSRARNLPVNLRVARQRFLQEIQVKKQEERAGAFAQNPTFQPVPIPYAGQPGYDAGSNTPGLPGLPAGPGAPTPEEMGAKEKAAKKPEKPQIQTGFSFNITPKLEYLNETTTLQRKSGNKTVVETGPTGASALQLRYDFSPDSYGRQMAIIGNFSGEYESIDTSAKDITVEIDTDGERQESAIGEDRAERNLTLEASPSLQVPFGETLLLEGGGRYREMWPDVQPEKKEVGSGPFGKFSVTLWTLNLNIGGEYLQKERLNGANELLLAEETTFNVGLNGPLPFFHLNFNLGTKYFQTSNHLYDPGNRFLLRQSFFGGLTRAWETVTVSGTITQTMNTPPVGTLVNGTAEELKAVAEVTKDLKFGATIKLSGEFAQISRYARTGLCEADEEGFIGECEGDAERTATATGERTGFGISIKLTPVDWAYANAGYEYAQTTFAVKEPNLQADFNNQVPDLVETITLLIGVTQTF